MSIYYLIAYPESVASLVNNGKLPDPLPSRCAGKKELVFTKEIISFLPAGTYPLDQVFILEILLRSSIPDRLILEDFDTETIQKIYVYSQKGANLINRLVNKSSFIKIQPELYKQKAELEEVKEADPNNKKTKDKRSFAQISSSACAIVSNSSCSIINEHAAKRQKLNHPTQNLVSEKSAQAKIFKRISTPAEHLQVLREAFEMADKNLLIMSYSVSHATLEQNKIYDLMAEACSRGVNIRIYTGDQQANIDSRTLNFFKTYQIKFSQTYTHSKILAVDNRTSVLAPNKCMVVSGSYNWLSAINTTPQSEEGSLICYGEICKEMIESFWKYIKYYRNQQFGKDKKVEQFEQDIRNACEIFYKKNGKELISYLPTLKAHRDFLVNCFKKAERRIIICSPFFSATSQFEEDISLELLKKTALRKVEIYFVCATPKQSSENEALKIFEEKLSSLALSGIQLKMVENIHLKTIIQDNNVIAEGSFNWLSAIRDPLSGFHNHEQTLVVRGEQAKMLIDDFFKTRIGAALSSKMNNQDNNSSHSSRIVNRP